jgi:hypothetical protein
MDGEIFFCPASKGIVKLEYGSYIGALAVLYLDVVSIAETSLHMHLTSLGQVRIAGGR